MSNEKRLVVYVDGSTRPSNPGYSGYGIFGYTLIPSKRPNKIKHPIKPKLNFTSLGLLEEKDTESYETVDIIEHIGCIDSNLGTNNLSEMSGFITTLRIAIEQQVTYLKVITDSNYVVLNFTENLQKWKSNGWRKSDGNTVIHKEQWELIDNLAETLQQSGCVIDATWVKGHSEDYGNSVADLYSVIGSNYSRIQFEERTESFQTVAYHAVLSYKDYKDSLAEKDIVFYFRDLFFSSKEIDDRNYCFLSTSENVNEQGRRDTSSIFLTNLGYVPNLINQIKTIYRNIDRFYVANCCIKLNKLEDRELARLARVVGVEKLLRPVIHNGITSLHLVKDNTPFVTEFTQEFPYITEVGKIFLGSLDVMQMFKESDTDVTDIFIKDGKINFSNQDKDIDITEVVSKDFESKENTKGITFINKLLVTVGKDIPNYVALKSIEDKIRKVRAITEIRPDNTFATLYIVFETEERTLCTVNITNKFLIKRA